MNCPKCNSENTQSFAMAYSSGASNISLETTTASGGILGSSFGGNVSKGSSSGTQLSVLASRTAPPSEERYKTAIILLGAGLFLACIKFWYGIIPFGLGGFLIYRAYNFNTNEYPILLANWKKKWICLKCGETFEL